MVTNEKSQWSLTTLVSWHYLALGDEKAVWCNGPWLHVHYTHREMQSGTSSHAATRKLWVEAELTDRPVGQRTLPMTTKLRSCFPPCRFSSSALTSICCFNLPDFLTGVCVELCSSDAWMVWDGAADLETESGTSEESMLISSLGCPFWGVWKPWPFSSAVTLKKAEIGKGC